MREWVPSNSIRNRIKAASARAIVDSVFTVTLYCLLVYKLFSNLLFVKGRFKGYNALKGGGREAWESENP